MMKSAAKGEAIIEGKTREKRKEISIYSPCCDVVVTQAPVARRQGK